MTSPLARCCRAVSFALVVGSIFASAAPTSAQSKPARLTKPHIVVEAINTSRPVSNTPAGSVGLAIAGGTPAYPSVLYVYMPAEFTSPFQLNVTGTDGRLVVTIEFDASKGTTSDWERIDLPSRNPSSKGERDSLLAQYFDDDPNLLAFAAFSKATPFVDTTQVLWPVASKRIEPKALARTKTAVLLKSGGAQTVVLQAYQTRKELNKEPKLGAASTCPRVKKREPFYYDTYCETTFGDLSNGVRVTRFLDDQTLDPILVQVPELKVP